MEVKSSSDFQLPPGFRFHPSDEELIVHYLKNKVTSSPLPASIIAEIDLYKYDPWELPKKAQEDKWYLLTSRGRKYPNKARPNRAAASGYWKATGTDKPIINSSGESIGVKKALVFYKGRPPKGTKADWIMHEFRLLDNTIIWNTKRKGPMRLDDWVLCRVWHNSCIHRNTWEDQNGSSYEPSGYFPKVNDLLRSYKNPNIEMVKSYLCNDCPMLPYIFVSQQLPFVKTSSTTSFQSSDKSCNSVYRGNSDDKNLQFSVTSFDNLFNLSKRKLAERNDQQQDWVPPTKKITMGDTENDEAVISFSKDDLNFCGTDLSSEDDISPAHWSSLMQYQELDHLTFTGSD